MSSTIRPKFLGSVVLADAAERGLNAYGLAKAIGKAPATITYFLSGQIQTVKTAEAIAAFLGYPIARYLDRSAASASRSPVPASTKRKQSRAGRRRGRGAAA